MRRVCGNFSFQLPRIKSRGSQALIQFRSDWSDNYGGFSAAVRFTAGERQGCGGIVNLTETSQVQLRAPDVAVNPRNDRIEGELDCQWTVLTLPGKVIRFQLTQIDMAATTASGNCDGDYLELRDGPGTDSSLIGRYCGSTSPPSLVGSNNIMSIRLVTGTSNRRANFVASVSFQERMFQNLKLQALPEPQTFKFDKFQLRADRVPDWMLRKQRSNCLLQAIRQFRQPIYAVVGSSTVTERQFSCGSSS